MIQEGVIPTAIFGRVAGRLVTCFLLRVAGMSLYPLPSDLVWGGGTVKSFPQSLVGPPLEPAVHRLDDITRIGHNGRPAWPQKRLQPKAGRDDFRLLICGRAEILDDKLACQPFLPPVFEQCCGSGRRRFTSVAET